MVSPLDFDQEKLDGRRQGRLRAKFFDDVRGSAIDCAACLDASSTRTILREAKLFSGKSSQKKQNFDR
jgi:hypothetical protein